MEGFNTKLFTDLLESEGFINAAKKFKDFAEQKQSETTKVLPKLHGIDAHEIDHYKSIKGFCVSFSKKSEENQVCITFLFDSFPHNSRKIKCYKDVSEIEDIKTTKEFWRFLREIFAEKVTNVLLGELKAKNQQNKNI